MNYANIKYYDIANGPGAVSYTHLDVYKRQEPTPGSETSNVSLCLTLLVVTESLP